MSILAIPILFILNFYSCLIQLFAAFAPTSSAAGGTTLFGQPQSQAGIFGQQQSKPLFGSTPAATSAPGFGFGVASTSTTGTSLFGQNKVFYFKTIRICTSSVLLFSVFDF